jgi:hypothetical protein
MTTKVPVKKLLPELLKESQTAREQRAAVELKPVVIRMAIYNAAKAGQMALRIKMPNNLDVRGTAAASTLEDWCKAEALILTWEKRTVDLEDGRRTEVFEPEISWLSPTK